ncbi:hypothetical protein [Vibrio crassostreae]|uniref:hypothetical protein n=1 Tax=Vibrio crassostreae TaxID=246167 RepID=UPI001B3016D0|nr:hypothetical protein [Vibrio crassostreae]
MNIFHALFAAIGTTVIALSAAAESLNDGTIDNKSDCADIMKAGYVTEGDEYKVCDEDYIANKLNFLFQAQYEDDDQIKVVYEMLDFPKPSESPNTRLVSSIASSMAMGVQGLFFTFFVGFFSIITLVWGAKLAKGESLTNMIKNSTTWSSGFSIVFVLALMIPIDLYMTGHSVILLLAGVGLKVANFLLSLTIGWFSFSANQSSQSMNASMYSQDGHRYANTMVDINLAARSSSAAFNKANEVVISGKANPNASTLAVLNSDGSKTWTMEDKDELVSQISTSDYVHHMLTHSSSSFEFGDLTKEVQTRYSKKNSGFGYSYGTRDSEGKATETEIYYSLNDTQLLTGRVVEGQVAPSRESAIHGTNKSGADLNNIGNWSSITNDEAVLVEPYLVSQVAAETVFLNPTFSQQTVTTGFDNYNMLEHIRGTGLLAQMANDGFSGFYDEKAVSEFAKAINVNAEQFLSTSSLDDANKNIIRKQYPKAMQAYLLGYYDYLGSKDVKTSNNHVFAFNPLKKMPFDSSGGVFEQTMRHAHVAGNSYMQYRCERALFEFDKSAPIISQIKLEDRFKEKPESPMSETLGIVGHSGQCFTYDSTPHVMIDDSLKQEVLTLLETNSAEEVKKLLLSAKSNYDASVNGKLLAAREERNKIIHYYANVMAATTAAGYQTVLEEEGGIDYAVLTEMRRSGASAAMGYFSRVANFLASIQEQLNKYTSSIAHVVSVEHDNLHPKIYSEFNRDKAAKISSTFIPIGEGRQEMLSLHNEVLSSNTSKQYKSVANETTINAIIADTLDLAIPGDESLKNGFGLDPNKTLVQNLEECSIEGACVDYQTHPLTTVTTFGRDLLSTGLVIVLLDAVIDALAMSIDSIVDSAAGIFGGLTDGSGKKGGSVKNIIQFFLDVGASMLSTALAIADAIMEVIQPLGMMFIVGGVILAFVLPLIPVLTSLMAWVVWLFEVIMTYILLPLFIALHLLRPNGQPILPFNKFAGLFVTILITPSLLYLSFVLFWVMSGVGIDMVMMAIGMILRSETDTGINLTTVSFSAISIGIMCYSFYKVTVKIVGLCYSMAAKVLEMIGVHSFAISSISDAEGLIGGAAAGGMMHKLASGGANIIPNNMKKKIDERIKKDTVAAKENEYNRIEHELKQHDINLSDYVGGKNNVQ